MTTCADRATDLLAQSKNPHKGVFITGPQQLELLQDELLQEHFASDTVITASLGNCRCTSDAKAIKQFTGHARVPGDAKQIALGHETLQMVLQAPASSKLTPGDLVVITPGHSALPIDPSTFVVDHDKGILCALGYSYRHLGGLRAFNAIPESAIAFVAGQGFGDLFNVVPAQHEASLVTLAHAEPFACNYGTNKHIYFINGQNFSYGVPARANIAYLGGTARMAMINLTIVANVPDAQLPTVVSITGSQRKLDELAGFDLIRRLQDKGVTVELIDRNADNIIERLTAHGQPSVIWTNFASQDVYDQATAAIAPGGNINNYAGASDPDLVLHMPIAAVPASAPADEAKAQIAAMHHNVAANDPQRAWGLDQDALVHLVGLDGERLQAWLQALPSGTRLTASSLPAGIDAPAGITVVDTDDQLTDVFIAGTGAAAAAAYADCELRLAKHAAVNLLDGDTTIAVRSRHSHYTTRHQICGPTVPWTMTNTSEPHADDMALQAREPVDFDWMVKGVCGLDHALDMMDAVEASQPFGSFYCYNELPGLPYIEISSTAFEQAAASCADETVKQALLDVATQLDTDNNRWSRRCEQILYQGFGLTHPLDLAK